MTSLAATRPRSRPDKALSPEEWIARRLNEIMLAIRRGRGDEVRALVDEIIDWAPAAIAPIEIAAEFAARREDWADLVRYRAALTAAQPANRHAKIAFIRSLIRAKATSAALDLVGRLLEREPAGAGFRRLRLEGLLAAGDRADAVALCHELADAPAGDGVAFAIDVAQILAQAEAYDMARDWVARAQTLHGDDPDLARLAATLADQGELWEEVVRAPDEAAYPPQVDPRPDDELSLDEWVGRRFNQVALAVRDGAEDEVRALVDEIVERAPGATAAAELAAQFATRIGDWADLVRYRAVLAAARPTDRRAKTALVRAMARAGLTSEALDLVDRLLEEKPIGAGYRRLRLEVLLIAGDADAIATLCQTLADAPADDSVEFTMEVAQILADAGKYSRARDWLARVQGRHGDSPALARLMATFTYRDGAWDEAERLWRDLASTGDERLKKAALIFRARIAVGAGRADDATAHYRQAFEDDDANEEAARHLVRLAIAEDRLDDAHALIARLERRVGRTVMMISLTARLAMAKGDSAAALAEYRRGLIDHPVDVDLRRDLADLHGNLGDFEAMDQVLSGAETLAPRDPAILSRRLTAGVARQLPPDQLLTIADRLLALRPPDQGILRQKANQLIRLGERGEALAVLIAAIEVNPATVSAWTAAIANMMILNDSRQAADFVDRARAIFSSETAPDLIAMAEILESADRSEEAVEYAERAVVREPTSAATRITAARLWEGRGLYRRAWPHLLALRDFEIGPARGVLTYARVARALHYVDRRPVAGAEADRFPDAIFDRMSRSAAPRQLSEAAPLVLHVTSSLAAGGSERQVALTVQGLATTPGALRPELVVQDMNPLTARDFFLPAVQAYGVQVSTLAEMRGEGAVRELMAARGGQRPEVSLLSALPTEVANVALPLYALILERRPRVVHLWQDAIVVAGGVAAMLAGVPHIVLSTRSTRPIERQRARPYLMAGYHALLRYPGTIMLNNSLNGARDYADWLGIDQQRIRTLHNGFVFSEIEARADPNLTANIRDQLEAGPDDVVIGGVMRCSFEKRPDLWAETVIALAEENPRIRGLLVGDGPMRVELEARAQARGLAGHVQFVGRQSPIEPWMRAMDILFLSSVTEGLPNVLIEAQALGVACATMRVGGAPETVLENETALVIDEGSIADIARAMAPLALDRGLRERFGAAGVAWAHGAFSLEATVARLGEIYAES